MEELVGVWARQDSVGDRLYPIAPRRSDNSGRSEIRASIGLACGYCYDDLTPRCRSSRQRALM